MIFDPSSSRSDVVLDVQNLHTHFPVEGGVATVVTGVNLQLRKGEMLGLVGESGCGKTVTTLSILGLLTPPGRIVEGSIRLGDTELVGASEKVLNGVRGSRIGAVFQQAGESLDPVMTIGRQVGQALPPGLNKRERRRRAVELLGQVGMPAPERRVGEHAHQLSGGMAQRAMIAIALAGEPEVLIADEPTASLDATVQAQIVQLLGDLQKSNDLSVILVSHDLDLVSSVADRVAVMYAGQIVEEGTIDQIYEDPEHPYTQALLRSRPGLGTGRLHAISGSVPSPVALATGCRFAPRCEVRIEKALSKCVVADPPLFVVGTHRGVRCWVHE